MNKAICLDVKGMSKWFGGLAANQDIDFCVEEGEIVSIIGPNGAGKSTLFNCITGFYKPNSGKVSFFGKDIYRMRADKICKLGIARTFQVVQVISDMTVLENVVTGALLRFSTIGPAMDKALEILAFTGLIDKKSFLGTELTIADKKRLEVSMALATQPRLLMLDESMAGLTPVELRADHRSHQEDPQPGHDPRHRGARDGSRHGDIGPRHRPEHREKNHGRGAERSVLQPGSHPGLFRG